MTDYDKVRDAIRDYIAQHDDRPHAIAVSSKDYPSSEDGNLKIKQLYYFMDNNEVKKLKEKIRMHPGKDQPRTDREGNVVRPLKDGWYFLIRLFPINNLDSGEFKIINAKEEEYERGKV